MQKQLEAGQIALPRRTKKLSTRGRRMPNCQCQLFRSLQIHQRRAGTEPDASRENHARAFEQDGVGRKEFKGTMEREQSAMIVIGRLTN